jgi:hypothetical protein
MIKNLAYRMVVGVCVIVACGLVWAWILDVSPWPLLGWPMAFALIGVAGFLYVQSTTVNPPRIDADALIKLATTRGSTGGLIKRIDENRELLEELQRHAPEFLVQHWWVEGWIQYNDSFFTQLQDILQVSSSHAPSEGYPRPWPGKKR